jgi:hypothetical protein
LFVLFSWCLDAERLSFQATAFDALERDFREVCLRVFKGKSNIFIYIFAQVLNQMVGDKTLERFKAEYEKLHNTLKKSHENEKKLIKVANI